MIQQKRWNTTSSNRKFPALSARGDWRRRTMWSDRLKMNRSPDRRGTCSPLLSSLSLSLTLSLSLCLYGIESVQAPDLSRCSARSRCRTLTLRGQNSLWLPPRFLWGSKVTLLSHLDLRLWTRHPHATCLNRCVRPIRRTWRSWVWAFIDGRCGFTKDKKKKGVVLCFIPSLDSFSQRDSCRYVQNKKKKRNEWRMMQSAWTCASRERARILGLRLTQAWIMVLSCTVCWFVRRVWWTGQGTSLKFEPLWSS